MSFYTVSGEVIQTIQENGGLGQWNGRNKNGLPVATGIYFYMIEQGTQVLNSGKFLMITGD